MFGCNRYRCLIPFESVSRRCGASIASFDSKTAVSVEASDLRQAFNDNEVNAANRYGDGKPLVLTGDVSKIEGGSPATVILESGDLLSKVDALVRDGQIIAALRPGDLVELHCVGARKSLSDIVVDSCNYIKKK